MKFFWYLIFSLCGCSIAAQNISPTHSLVISGKVKSSLTIPADDFCKFTAHVIGDLVITNHIGDPRGTAKSLKGILLRDVLQRVEIDAENPKVLSEYFFVCKASDEYTVVFFWNEIFNTPIGNGIYLVTEKEGKSFKDMTESLLLVSTKDIRTGRRHVKSLTTIVVARAK